MVHLSELPYQTTIEEYLAVRLFTRVIITTVRHDENIKIIITEEKFGDIYFECILNKVRTPKHPTKKDLIMFLRYVRFWQAKLEFENPQNNNFVGELIALSTK